MLAFASVALLATGAARAVNPNITVTTDDDVTHTCATTGTGTCSLRDAITYANATSGADTIVFDIAPAGLHTISPGSAFPKITEAVTIDGYTQPASGGGTAHANTLAVGNDALILIEIDGSGAGAVNGGLLDVGAGPSMVRGLAVNRTVGGNSAAIRVSGQNVTIAGNFVGTDAAGTTFPGNGCNGVSVVGSGNTIGGAAPAARNVISATGGCGINLILSAGSNNTVRGNYIGTDAAGSVGDGGLGIDVADGATNNQIGGVNPGEGNLISGNSIEGIRIRNSGTAGNYVEGNLIGTKANGTGSLPNGTAIEFFDNAHDNVIGGDSAAAGNVIANNAKGVVLNPDTGSGNAILSNAIFANTGLGIDLGDDGVTANDPLDADSGPNGLQNHPTLTAVSESSVEGVLRSAPNKSYTLQFFASTACHSSGYGEGRTLVQTTVVGTDAGGVATFGVSLTVPSGQAVTATATETGTGTSEFSSCVLLVPTALVVDGTAGGSSNGDGVLEPGETVTAAPSWQNGTSSDVATSGQASGFGGPVGPTYGTPDSAASYGTIAAGTTGSCAVVPDCYAFSVNAPAVRPVTHWDAQFTETLPGAVSQSHLWKLHVGDSFTDVPRANPFYKRIETVLHAGVTVGCTATEYCPSQKVARDQMAIFIARAIAGGGANVPSSGTVNASPYDCSPGGVSLFSDVSPTAPACKSVHYLAAQNVAGGCAPGLFCPAALVSRAEMSIFVAKGIVAPGGGPAVPTTYGPDPVTGLSYSCNPATPNLHFTDVSTGDTFCRHVHFLWAKGVISGCSATQYCPAGQVGRDEMAKFLSNAFRLLLYGP